MSIADDRSELAGALSTVEGVHGWQYRPTGIRTGHAWPLLDVLQGSPAGFQATWHVLVVLPSDERKASEWLDAKHEAIAEALEYFGFVEQIYPEGLRTPEGDLQVMRLILRREA